MLSVKSYDIAYVAQCRARYADAISGFQSLSAVPPGLEAMIFNEMVLALDTCFCHRMRGQEGKDGNPLNEVRMLVSAIATNGGIFAADPTIKYATDISILGLKFGDKAALSASNFAKLKDAFLDEIERRFA